MTKDEIGKLGERVRCTESHGVGVGVDVGNLGTVVLYGDIDKEITFEDEGDIYVRWDCGYIGGYIQRCVRRYLEVVTHWCKGDVITNTYGHGG